MLIAFHRHSFMSATDVPFWDACPPHARLLRLGPASSSLHRASISASLLPLVHSLNATILDIAW